MLSAVRGRLRRVFSSWLLPALLCASGPLPSLAQTTTPRVASSGANRVPETLNFANGLLRSAGMTRLLRSTSDS
jgi:hypothetical protein